MEYNYLHEIGKYRSENISIIYLRKIWLDTQDIVGNGWDDSSGN